MKKWFYMNDMQHAWLNKLQWARTCTKVPIPVHELNQITLMINGGCWEIENVMIRFAGNTGVPWASCPWGQTRVASAAMHSFTTGPSIVNRDTFCRGDIYRWWKTCRWFMSQNQWCSDGLPETMLTSSSLSLLLPVMAWTGCDPW